MDVDIGCYFEEKRYDDKLLDFIRYDVKTPKKTKYILQRLTATDEESVRLQRFYQLGVDLKLKYSKRRSLKKQGRIKNATEELLRLANEQLKLFNLNQDLTKYTCTNSKHFCIIDDDLI